MREQSPKWRGCVDFYGSQKNRRPKQYTQKKVEEQYDFGPTTARAKRVFEHRLSYCEPLQIGSVLSLESE